MRSTDEQLREIVKRADKSFGMSVPDTVYSDVISILEENGEDIIARCGKGSVLFRYELVVVDVVG